MMNITKLVHLSNAIIVRHTFMLCSGLFYAILFVPYSTLCHTGCFVIKFVFGPFSILGLMNPVPPFLYISIIRIYVRSRDYNSKKMIGQSHIIT